ncbi:phage tail tape measure protein [Oenococcus sicerae]|uniref:Phage tail tape measure protein n=1 Tax=Oenococcus sicerae TaxID=2203724 RepID=A0AAJ1RB62_9LACO|nr:phage tail tape measure protein [Oenococcus sicerae]MDN6899577.1 phage tail tape measure protein [Oenococcus sicerae]
MAGTIKGITIEINGNTTGLEASLKGVNKTTKDLQSELRTVNKDMKFNPTSFTLASQKSELLSKTVSSLRTKLDALKSAQAQVDQQFKEGKIGEDQYRAFNREIAETQSKLGYYDAELESVQKATSGLGASTKLAGDSIIGLKQKLDAAAASAEKFKTLGNNIAGVGKTLTSTLTLGIGAGFVYAAKQAITFDGQMQQIRALLNDGSVSQSTLSKQIEELGNQSKKWSSEFGISTSDINAGFEEIVKRGYTYKQAVGAMPSILNAAKASGDDFNTVMTASTSILEQFGLKASSTSQMLKNTQRVTDSLTYVANKTSAGFEDMATAMTYVGPTAHSAGISLEETAAAIGLLSNNGIEADKAGTGLRGALTKLLKPSDANAAAMAEMGVSVEAFKKGTLTLPQILDKIKTNTAGWTKEQKASAIATAFGTNAQAAMNVLVDQGGSALTNLTKETQGATGYTKKLADQLNNTSQNNVKKFVESLQNLATTLGQDVVPLITPFVNKLTDMAKGFSQMSKGEQETVLKTAALVAGLGPALVITGKLITAYGTLKGALATMGSRLVISGASAATADTAIAGLGASTEGAAVSAGLLGTALTPLAVGLGVAAGVVGIGALAWEAWGKKAYEASRSTASYGADISKTTQGQFDDLSGKVDTVTASINKLGNPGPNKKSLDNFKTSFDKLVKDVNNNIDLTGKKIRSSKKETEAAYKDGLISKSTYDKVMEQLSNQGAAADKLAVKQKSDVKGYQSEINKIYADIASNGGNASKQNLDNLKTYVDKIADIEIDNMKGLSSKSKDVLKNLLKNSFSNMPTGEVETALKNYEKVVDKTLQSNAKQTDQYIKDMAKEHINVSKQAWNDYFKDNAAYLAPLQKGFQQEFVNSLNPRDMQQVYKNLDALSQQLGIPLSQLEKQFGLAGMNIKSQILTTTSQWNNTKFKELLLKVNGTQALTTLENLYSNSHTWNSLSLKTQEAIISTKGALDFLTILMQFKTWNNLTPKQQKIILNDLASGKLQTAEKHIRTWNDTDPSPKELSALDKVSGATNSAQKKISNVRQYGAPMLVAKDGTYNGTHTAQVRINNVHGKTVGIYANADPALAKIQNLKYILSHINATISVNANVSASSAANRSSTKIAFYANGGVFTKPTLFSNNGQNSVVGEAGAEAALPLNAKTYGGLAKGIVDAMGRLNVSSGISDKKVNTMIDLLGQLVQGQGRPGLAVLDKNQLYRQQAQDQQLKNIQSLI